MKKARLGSDDGHVRINSRSLLRFVAYLRNPPESASPCRIHQYVTALNKPFFGDFLRCIIMPPCGFVADFVITNALLIEDAYTALFQVSR